ncbi:MAG: TonB-dependent receptor domain-containing protein, partial [Thermoanaerobaculia bacterium]
SFTNPAWDKTSDHGETQQESVTDETYEATLGGRIVRDRLWFFGAGRYVEQTFPAFFFDGGALDVPVERPSTIQTDERYEVKLTGQVTPKHSLVGSYLSYEVDQTPHCAFGCWELSTMDLDGRQLPREMTTAQYNGILSSNLLVEVGYSTRDLQFVGSGGDHLTTNFNDARDIALGTWAYDYTVVGGAWGAPIFCGICDPEVRENEYLVLKSTYYMATAGAGTHNIVGGYENFSENRLANNYQSGSNFGIYVFGMSPEFDADGSFRPIISSGDLLRYSPIEVLSKGSDFVTDSVFVNDKWDFNSKWSFNIGVRYDVNDGKDSAGNQISDDSAFSPRIGAIYDIRGDGRIRVNASYSKYVSRIQETVGGAGGGGTPSAIYYIYDGPQIGGAGTGLGSFDVLEQFFQWFLGIGGTDNTSNLVGATIPGVNTRFNGSLASPNTEEFTIGFGTQIGSKGFLRLDVIDREWADFYTTTTTPGDQVEVLGNPLDVLTYTNTDQLERTYQAVQLQGNYRLSDRVNIGANYTWSEAKGNDVGETAGGGPATSLAQTYPEYRAFAQNNPVGFLPTDQEHKARLWISYDQPLGAFGNLNLSLLERFDSGLPYSATANVDVAAYTANPGYATPPATVLYYFSDRGEYRFEDATATDLSVNWELPIRNVNVFVQGELLNAFNEQAQIGGGAAVTVTQAFNPFTETPNECLAGTATATCAANNQHWRKSTAFGQSTGAASYQLPLTYRVSAGIRF